MLSSTADAGEGLLVWLWRATFFLENAFVNLVFISGQHAAPNVNLYWNVALQTKALKHVLRNCMLP